MDIARHGAPSEDGNSQPAKGLREQVHTYAFAPRLPSASGSPATTRGYSWRPVMKAKPYAVAVYGQVRINTKTLQLSAPLVWHVAKLMSCASMVSSIACPVRGLYVSHPGALISVLVSKSIPRLIKMLTRLK